MGLIQKLTNKIVFLDTAPLIYYIEEKQQYLPLLDKLFLANSKGRFLLKTSADYLLTNDLRLKVVKEIEVLVLDELAGS